MYYIYKLENRVNGKVYIGKSKNPKIRMNQHRHKVKVGSQYKLHNAIRKYGEHSFDLEILLEFEDENDAFKAEIETILEYNSFSGGYNMTKGGDCGPKRSKPHTQLTKDKISDSNFGVSRGKGISKSISHRESISKSHLGKTKPYRNGRTKEWCIMTPIGETIIVDNLTKFEKEQGLKVNSIRNTLRTKKPHYSGYMALAAT